MGLFGGFKGKFTRKAPKNKGPTEVVCLKYKIFSEFDQPPTYSASVSHTPRSEISRNQIPPPKLLPPLPNYATKPSIPQEEINAGIQTEKPKKLLAPQPNYTSKPDLHLPKEETNYTDTHTEKPRKQISTKLASPLPNYATKPSTLPPQEYDLNADIQVATSATFEFVTTSKSTFKPESIITDKNNNSNKNATVFASTSLYTYNNSDHENEAASETLTESYFMSKDKRGNQDDMDIYEKSTLMYMTENRVVESENYSEPEETSSYIVEEPTTSYFDTHTNGNQFDNSDEEDYQVNIVKHDASAYKSTEQSDDEESVYSDDNHLDYNAMGYSSQAASIFFGGDEDTEIIRPRNIKFDEDDDDKDSSASA